MITKDKLKWTKEDDDAVKEYKDKLERGEIKTIPLDIAVDILKKRITNTKEAVNTVKKLLPNGIKVIKKGQHFDLLLMKNIYHLKFANESFHSLGKFFPEWEGEEGESINVNSISHLNSSDHIIFVTPLYIKTIDVDKLKNRGKMRTQKNGEVTYSIPVSFLEDFNGTNN